MTNVKSDPDFVHFLESMGNLDALDRISKELDDQLKDYRIVMDEIQGKIDMPLKDEKSEPNSNLLRREDLTEFLSSPTPTNSVDTEVNIDDVITRMKCYTEDLKKSLTLTVSPTQALDPPNQLERIDLELYASNLDQLCKRLSTLRLNKRGEVTNRSAELEDKLSLLCDDVNMFTKMVQSKATLSEANENWSPSQQKTNALDYDNLVNKLLSGINEVACLLIVNKN